MNKAEAWLRGYCRVSVRGTSPEEFLNTATAAAIPFWDVSFPDAFSLQLSIPYVCMSSMEKCCRKSACIVEKREYHGLRHRYGGLKRRIALLLMLVLALGGALRLSAFVWFIQVDGNKTVPAEVILRAAERAGVQCGSFGPDIDPQVIKDRVLEEIPQLKWLTVTQNGFSATIHVREREILAKPDDRKFPADLVAARGGMITDISVLDGMAVVAKGDVVAPGDVLISGRVAMEQAERLCRGSGEVYAETWYDRTAVTDKNYYRKGERKQEKNSFYLILGKKKIKIFGNSGNYRGICDKIITRKEFRLPGGYVLPIAVEKITVTERQSELHGYHSVSETGRLEEAVLSGIKETMLAGEIQSAQWTAEQKDGLLFVHGLIHCREMIAKEKPLDIG